MPTVAELSGAYENFLLNPRPGAGICRRCFTFVDPGYSTCYPCRQMSQMLESYVPISYSIAHGQLHRALAGYKRAGGSTARRLQLGLGAVLWRFLVDHEPCLATAAGAPAFDLVTTVPSGDRQRDRVHPLPEIVGEIVAPTRDRYERVLARSTKSVAERAFDREKCSVSRRLDDACVLLIDDTWTTGASAQSAAAALLDAGAAVVAAVTIGRHVNPEWGDTEERVRHLPHGFDWDTCGVHAV
jgi:predicted amidophosphoribosyltransferase